MVSVFSHGALCILYACVVLDSLGPYSFYKNFVTVGRRSHWMIYFAAPTGFHSPEIRFEDYLDQH